MPRALVIEFSGSRNGVALTNSNGHGNTVRSTFLAFAPEGWTCDVVESGFDFGVAFLSWFDSRASSYDLCICSNTVDLYYARNLDKLVTDYGKPFFAVIANNPPTATENLYYQKGNMVYSGVGITSNTGSASNRIDTFSDPSNLTYPNRGYTSFSNAVTAGKCAALVDAGLTPNQIIKAVRQQAGSYPTWTQQNGFGASPLSYSVPQSYDRFPPQACEMYRGSNNTLQIYFTVLDGDSPTALKVYRNGVLDATIASGSWSSTVAGSTMSVVPHYFTSYTVVSDGGSFEFDLALQFADGESQRFDWNKTTVSGFTDNNVDPAPPEPEPPTPEPEPPSIPEDEDFVSLVPQFMLAPKKYQFNLVKKSQISEAPKGIGFMVIGSTFRVS